MKLPVWLLAIVRSVAPVMVVVSFAVLLAVLTSPPPDTAATFVTDAGAFAATFTVNVMSGYAAPAGSWSPHVQVSVDNVHDQPVPDIAVAVRPDGSVSVTVT